MSPSKTVGCQNGFVEHFQLYGGLGRQVLRGANGVTTGYLHDGINLLSELGGNGAIAAKYTG